MRKFVILICTALAVCTLAGILAGCTQNAANTIDVSSAAEYDEAEFIAGLREVKDIALAADGESGYVIVLETDNVGLASDAVFLRDTLRQMTGAEESFEVLAPSNVRSGDKYICLGENALSAADTSGAKDDGYIIRSIGENIYISGNYALNRDIADDGTANGIYSFLEDCLGCMFVRDDFSYIPESSTVWLDELDVTSNPDFVWRRIYQYEVGQNDWSRRIKSNGTGERLDDVGNDANRYWGTWCHSSFHFVDPDIYFDGHPEYYAVIGGERRCEAYGDMQAQLCLSAFVTTDGDK